MIIRCKFVTLLLDNNAQPLDLEILLADLSNQAFAWKSEYHWGTVENNSDLLTMSFHLTLDTIDLPLLSTVIDMMSANENTVGVIQDIILEHVHGSVSEFPFNLARAHYIEQSFL